MTITTKYSINDLVWIMRDGRAEKLKVRQVSVTIDGWHTFGKNDETYFLADGNTAFCHHEWYPLRKIFPTKEEL
jgi:hypothetical protein